MGTRSLAEMFRDSVNLTGNFSGWNTSKITNMAGTFSGAANFDQDISSWVVSGVSNFTAFLGTHTGATNPKLSTRNYNQLLANR
jgi:surface protein